MLKPVDVGTEFLENYVPLLNPKLVQKIRDLGKRLRGARLLRINATPYEGDFSDLLRSVANESRVSGGPSCPA